MSNQEMHEQDLEVVRMVNANARQKKAQAVYYDAVQDGTWDEDVAFRAEVLKKKVLPVLIWAAGAVAFLAALAMGSCTEAVAFTGAAICTAGAVSMLRMRGKEYV